MQSQINCVDSQTLMPKPAIAPGRILISSKDLAWDGIYIEKGEKEGCKFDDVTMAQHCFVLNVGQSFEWECKEGKTFKTYRYDPGDLWINPAGVPCSYRTNAYKQFVLVALDQAKVVEALPEQTLIESPVFRRQHKSQDKHLQALIQALLIEAESGGPNGKLYADALSTALATHFVNHYSMGIALDFPGDMDIERQRLGQVIDYVEAYLTEDLSLDDLALVSGFSKFHFSRLFKQAFGLTPHRYLMRRRVERAAIVLRKSSKQEFLTIAQVAHQFSFADQSHFTRMFKQVKGVTPKQFLQQY